MAVNIIFAIIMVVLAIVDIKSIKSINHKDFKSAIITLGILGAFVGIFLGLLAFEGDDTQDSMLYFVSTLKTSILPLIIATTLHIIISIYQRIIGYKSGDKENLNFLTLQAKKFDKLDKLEYIANMNNEHKKTMREIKDLLATLLEKHTQTSTQIVESNDKNFKILLEANERHHQLSIESSNVNCNTIVQLNKQILKEIQSCNQNLALLIEANHNDLQALLHSVDDLKMSFEATFERTICNLQSLQSSMQDSTKATLEAFESFSDNVVSEIGKLSSHFSSDVISQIDNLIQAFREMISKHFHQNFIRFNAAIDNLLEWQHAYKQNIIDSNIILSKSSKSIVVLDKIIANIINRDEKTIEIYKEVSLIMSEYKAQNANFTDQLEAFRVFHNGVEQSLQSLEGFFANLTTHFQTTNDTMLSHIKGLFDNLSKRDSELFDNMESSLEAIKQLSQFIHSSNEELLQNYSTIAKDLEIYTKAISQNTSEMISNINKDGITHLKHTTKAYFDDINETQNKILSNMSNHIHKHHEKLGEEFMELINNYLQSLEKITLSSLEATKDVNLANLHDIKILGNEILQYIRDNALSLNKSNMELLNVIEILQKQVEISLDKSKAMQDNATDSIKDIETSLQNLSEGFKNDYEWFLRRIKDMIGQRL